MMDVPQARVAVLDGTAHAPGQPWKHGKQTIKTLWGELAWQLGGSEAFALVKEADATGTSPGKDVLQDLLARYAPCVVLIDELVAYIRQFRRGSDPQRRHLRQQPVVRPGAHRSGEARARTPSCWPRCRNRKSRRAANAASRRCGRWRRPSAASRRSGSRWPPRKRSRSCGGGCSSRSATTRPATRSVAPLPTPTWPKGPKLPAETQEGRYYDRLVQAYPIHPEVFDRLYEDWTTIDGFPAHSRRAEADGQGHLPAVEGRQQGSDDPARQPALYDGNARNELIYYLPPGWDPVIERDIDGERAGDHRNREPGTDVRQRAGLPPRGAHECSWAAPPSTPNQLVRGLELERVMLGVVQPGQQIGCSRMHCAGSVTDCTTSTVPTTASGSTRGPTCAARWRSASDASRTRRMCSRHPRARAASLATACSAASMSSPPSGDVPDDWQLRLVVLPPDAAFSRAVRAWPSERGQGDSEGSRRAAAAEAEPSHLPGGRLRQRQPLEGSGAVHAGVAVDRADIRDMKLNLDQFQAKQARQEPGSMPRTRCGAWCARPTSGCSRRCRRPVPARALSEVQWEHFPLNPGAPNPSQEIERVLKENELLITEWAPIHLASVLKTWFWKDDVRR